MEGERLERVRCNLCGCGEAAPVMSVGGFSYVRCVACGLVYVNPRPADLRGWHLRRYAEGRDGSGPDADIRRQYAAGRSARLAREARSYGRFRRLNRILDVGCSAGAFLAAAVKEGWKATGVEISPDCARAGRERLGLDIRVGTLAEANFPHECFDVIRMNNILEHLPDPMADLSEAGRVLRSGGLLSLATVNGRSLAALLSGKAWRYYDPRCHAYIFTPRTLRRMLRAAGFGEIRIRTHGFRWGTSPARAGKALGAVARLTGLGHRMRAKAVKTPNPSRGIAAR